MVDEPDPESPYYILRQADAPDRTSHVQLELRHAEAGPPITIPWKVPAHANKNDRPADVFAGDGLGDRIEELEADPAVIVSKALATRLEALAPGAISGYPVRLVSVNGGEALDYVAVDGIDTVEARSAESAREGEHQWGDFAFRASDAPAQIFTLARGDDRYLLVSREIGDTLRGEFTNLHLSAFHRTTAVGGIRPAIAALKRLLGGKPQPDDRAFVTEAVAEGRPEEPAKATTKPAATAKPKPNKQAAKPKKPATKAKAKAKAKPTAKAKAKAKPKANPKKRAAKKPAAKKRR
jgi:hypothetical protein